MKKPPQFPLLTFAICFSAFLLVYLLSNINQCTTQLFPNEEHIRQTIGVASSTDGFYNNQIDINAASADLLSMLPGVGKTIAERIVSYRQTNGLFKSIQDLEKVPGLGEKSIENIAKYITVGGLS